MTKYLDENGLSYFWTKIKSWLSSHAPVKYFGQNWIEDADDDYVIVIGDGADESNPSNSILFDKNGNILLLDGSMYIDNTEVRNAGIITSGVFDADRIPNMDAGKIVTGTFNSARIPNLDASKIMSGTLADARIPGLNASKITAGTFADARIPGLNASKITAGTLPVARGGTGITNFFNWNNAAGNNVTVGSSPGSYPKLASVTLSAGTWLLLIGCYAASASSGARLFALSTAGSMSSPPGRGNTLQMPGGGTQVYQTWAWIVQPTGNTTYNVFAWQNSGNNLAMSAQITYFRVK